MHSHLVSWAIEIDNNFQCLKCICSIRVSSLTRKCVHSYVVYNSYDIRKKIWFRIAIETYSFRSICSALGAAFHETQLCILFIIIGIWSMSFRFRAFYESNRPSALHVCRILTNLFLAFILSLSQSTLERSLTNSFTPQINCLWANPFFPFWINFL